MLERVARRVFDKKLKAGELDKETYTYNLNRLQDAVTGELGNIKYGFPSRELLWQFKNNIQTFTAFKGHRQTSELVRLLERDAMIESFASFRDKAMQVLGKYNENWLNAEYNQAVSSAQMAEKWLRIQQRKDELPFLQYRTAGDKRVRKGHQKLNNITLPVDDSFWDTWYPPNGWGCRCDINQVAGPRREAHEVPTEAEVPQLFRINPGKSGEVFSTDHPYFDQVGISKTVRDRLIKQKNKLVFDSYPETDYVKKAAKSKFERFLRSKPELKEVIGYDDKSGGYVVVHKKHNARALQQELPICKILKDKGYQIELRDEANLANTIDTEIRAGLYELKNIEKANGEKGVLKRFEVGIRDVIKQKKGERAIFRVSVKGVNFEDALKLLIRKVNALKLKNYNLKTLMLIVGEKVEEYDYKEL